MKIFLGALLVLAVSGVEEDPVDEEVTFESILDSSVLLRCPCPSKNIDNFKWQKETPTRIEVFPPSSDINDPYKGRTKIFVAQDKYNCSLLLTNITVDDQGKYRCSFFTNERYNRFFVNLKVYARYSVCQSNSPTNRNGNVRTRVFQCDVQGRYRDAEIQWYLDRQLLTNSSTTTITHTYAPDDVTGLYSFSSKLITELRGTSEPTCDVKAKGISTNTSCTSSRAKQTSPDPKCIKRYLKIIPIVLLLGFSLVLWCRWKHSHGLLKMRKVETDYLNC